MKMLLDFLYPKICMGCDKVFDYNNRLFCPECEKKVIYARKNVCVKCGKPIENVENELCFDCKKRTREFVEHRALYVYKGALKHAMYRFKYYNMRHYGTLFAKEIYKSDWEWLIGIKVDAVVPIPMYKSKERSRGYNQAKVLAKEISKYLNVPMDDSVLVRAKNTIPMKNLNDVQRRRNLENAFICKAINVEYSRLLLIDDIFTTGATFDSASRVLKQSGVKEIYGYSVCVGWGS